MNFENNGIITDNIISRETPPHLPQPPNDVVLIGSPQNNLISPSVAIPVSTSSSSLGGSAGGVPIPGGAGGGPSSHNQHKTNADNVVQPTSDGSSAVVPAEHSTSTTPTTTTTSTTNWNEINQSPQKQEYQQQIVVPPPNALGILRHENNILYIIDHVVVIGRNSSTSSVNFHVAQNSFVSRKHFQVLFDIGSGEFYLNCLSKNGVFVDDVFQRRNSDPIKLPKMCTFRFPSTDIRILFESFTDSDGTIHHQTKQSLEPTSSIDEKSAIYPLQISIPKSSEQKSPYPSPTGTISAANSCPTSPGHNFQDYPVPGLFQPPSTSTYSNNEHEKPPYSYAQLIVQSIAAAPDKQLTLAGIYSFISKNYPYYRKEANKGWQNSIRHNLSLNRYFVKVARSQDEPGKGSFWRIDPVSESKLIDQSYKKRRQRSSQCFRPNYGMPSSAPVSPTHMGDYQDISRENSPLRDVVLHSAPGSPGTYDIPEYDEEICTLTEQSIPNKRPKYSTEMHQ